MKVSLINLNPESRYPKLGLGYLASYAQKYYPRNLDIRIHDAATSKNMYSDVSAYDPDLIGVSCLTMEHGLLQDFARKNREDLGKPLIVGGTHYSAWNGFEEYIDIVVKGEGERTFLDILNNTHDGEVTNLGKIKGISFRDEAGYIKTTDKREVISNLDAIPYPNRDLFDMAYYAQPIQSDTGRIARETQIISSRGCPHSCKYCASSAFWGNKVRYFSPEYVVGEVEELVNKYGIDSVLFFDDNFALSKPRVKKISALIKERGLDKEAMFGCFSRADTMDNETAQYLGDMNVISIVFGFETGSDRTLGYLKNNTVSVEDNRKAIRVCKDNGIRVASGFMAGSPFETKQDLQDTIRFIEEEPLDTGWVSPVLAFPGTKLWDYAVASGIIDPNTVNWSGYATYLHHKIEAGEDPFRGRPILTREMDREEFTDLFRCIQEALERKSYRYYEEQRQRSKGHGEKF
jgi:radical SAM superfamily enzyme YgiQ (UPF0313 family)